MEELKLSRDLEPEKIKNVLEDCCITGESSRGSLISKIAGDYSRFFKGQDVVELGPGARPDFGVFGLGAKTYSSAEPFRIQEYCNALFDFTSANEKYVDRIHNSEKDAVTFLKDRRDGSCVVISKDVLNINIIGGKSAGAECYDLNYESDIEVYRKMLCRAIYRVTPQGGISVHDADTVFDSYLKLVGFGKIEDENRDCFYIKM